VRLIISVNSYGELYTFGFDYKNLEKRGIRHIFVFMIDYGSDVSDKAVINAVHTAYQTIRSFGKVLVHCKAGRSRSALIVALIVAYYENINLKEAIEKISQRRSQVDIGSKKIKKGEIILNKLNDIETYYYFEKDKVFENTYSYLCSFEFKNNLCQFPSFKKLLTYLVACSPTQGRAQHLQDLLDRIRTAHDEIEAQAWYEANVSCLEGSDLYLFLESHPTIDDRTTREELVNDFMTELKAHVARPPVKFKLDI